MWYENALKNEYYSQHAEAVGTSEMSSRWKVCLIDSHREKGKQACSFMSTHMNAICQWRATNHIDHLADNTFTVEGKPIEDWFRDRGYDFDSIWPSKVIDSSSDSNYLVVIDDLKTILNEELNSTKLKELADMRVPGVRYEQPSIEPGKMAESASDKCALQLLMAIRQERLFRLKQRLNKNFRHIQIYDCADITLNKLVGMTGPSKTIAAFLKAVSACNYYPESLRGVLLFQTPGFVMRIMRVAESLLDKSTMAKFKYPAYTRADLNNQPLELSFGNLPSMPIEPGEFQMNLTADDMAQAQQKG
jgi:hypothetical protein